MSFDSFHRVIFDEHNHNEEYTSRYIIVPPQPSVFPYSREEMASACSGLRDKLERHASHPWPSWLSKFDDSSRGVEIITYGTYHMEVISLLMDAGIKRFTFEEV